MTRNIRIWFFICLLFVFGMLSGCGKTQAAHLLESYEAVSMAMRVNMENPDAVLAALDDCIVKYGEFWETTRRSLETRSPEALDREMNQYDAEFRAIIIELLNLDLEFQDRFYDRPEVLQAYYSRLKRIGMGELQ